MSFEEIVDRRMDGQISLTIAHLEHFVLRWAKKESTYLIIDCSESVVSIQFQTE